MVRAIRARFEASAGRFQRQVNDANAEFQESVDAIEKKRKEFEENRQRVLAEFEKKRAEQEKEAEREKLAATGGWQVKDWGTGSVMSFGPDVDDRPSGQPFDQTAGRPASPAQPMPQPATRAPYPASAATPPSTPPSPQPSSPTPHVRHTPRPRHDDEDDDYSGFSWTQ